MYMYVYVPVGPSCQKSVLTNLQAPAEALVNHPAAGIMHSFVRNLRSCVRMCVHKCIQADPQASERAYVDYPGCMCIRMYIQTHIPVRTLRHLIYSPCA
jgi:hypothetical protein